MKYLFSGWCIILMNYSISQTFFNFTLEQSKNIDEIQNLCIKKVNNNEVLNLISKEGNLYKFEDKSETPFDTLVIELKTLKYTYEASIYVREKYFSNPYPLHIELLSYKRFLRPKYYNMVITYNGISQPFFVKRYKNK
ncbi:MAG TPA: hypothetical protein VKX31_05505 [Brumimicrobium sp.]|nr:hypothetical protein [Brumimicrobium sp.]